MKRVPGGEPSAAAKLDAPAAGPGNLGLRILSALVLAPLALAAAYEGSWGFALFWTVAALVVLWEWIKLIAGAGHLLMFSSCGAAIAVSALIEMRHRPVAAILLVGLGALASLIFAPPLRRNWVAGGVAYAGAMLLAPMLLRLDPQYGLQAILLLFGVVWTTDVLAFFAGRTFGGPRLCPPISPKKTWSGAIAGALGGLLAALALERIFAAAGLGVFNPVAWAALGLGLSAISQAGDLLESWIKRRFGAKDASALIPGHGGAMDRLDGFWAAAVAGCLIGIAHGGFHNVGLGLLVW
jgi:phosphatidate cytidylyltransferase